MQGLLAAVTLLLTLGFGYVAPARSLPPEAPATQPSSITIYQAFDLTQTNEFDTLISQAAEDWRLDPFLLKGLLFEESGFNPKIRNKTSYAAGIAQFTKGGIRGMNVIRCRRLQQSYRCDLGDDEFTLIPGGSGSAPVLVLPARVRVHGLAIPRLIVAAAGPGAGNLEVSPVVGGDLFGVVPGRLPAPQSVDADPFLRGRRLPIRFAHVPNRLDALRQRRGWPVLAHSRTDGPNQIPSDNKRNEQTASHIAPR